LFAVRAAGSQEPVKIENDEVREHRIGPGGLIHSKAELCCPPQNHVILHVVVDAAGQVESVAGATGPEEFFGEAERVEAKQKFKPFEREGIAVRASFSDYVSIVPPEQWAEAHSPFPEVKDLSSLRMRLQRTRCYGPCPAYAVEVKGDGSVEFEGTENVLIIGHHHGQITKEAVQKIVAAFRRADYFSLKDSYAAPITDNPSYVTSIEFDQNKKSVRDYVGIQVGMPESVRALEDTIDQMTGTEKWVKGNEQTGAALVAEGWDFRANTEENRTLFANVVAHGSEELIQLFVSRGAPALDMTKAGEGPLLSAAAKGDLKLVKLMMTDQPEPSVEVLSCALGNAARSGNLDLVQWLLAKGGDPNGPPCGRYEGATVLMRAAQSGKAEVVEAILQSHPDVNARNTSGLSALSFFLQQGPSQAERQRIVRLLLTSGADVNSRDQQDQTPVFYACENRYSEALRVLIASGADVNVKNRNGQTVLMSCFDKTSLQILIGAGADPTIRNSFGRTAAEEARQMGAIDKAVLLEAASKERASKQE
jgi:ankyrin repeat protein